MSDASSPRSRWRLPHVQLSVRALMALVLVLGGVFGWVGHRARVQRLAVEAIVRGGGRVYYDWEMIYRPGPEGPRLSPNPKAVPKWPKWLVNRVGPDYLGVVKAVRIGREDPDAVLAHVARLGGLATITFGATVPVGVTSD